MEGQQLFFCEKKILQGKKIFEIPSIILSPKLFHSTYLLFYIDQGRGQQ